MKERRVYKRFPARFPIKLEAITSSRKRVLDLTTRDISVSGTFIITLTSFPEGTRFFLDFNIPRESFEVLKEGTKSLRGYTGSMVRSTPCGMAIKFDRECQIEGLKYL
jgi:hypothetical protein